MALIIWRLWSCDLTVFVWWEGQRDLWPNSPDDSGMSEQVSSLPFWFLRHEDTWPSWASQTSWTGQKIKGEEWVMVVAMTTVWSANRKWGGRASGALPPAQRRRDFYRNLHNEAAANMAARTDQLIPPTPLTRRPWRGRRPGQQAGLQRRVAPQVKADWLTVLTLMWRRCALMVDAIC